MHFFALLPTVGASIFLILALALAFGFECVNGFHDTANAVATVIYTNTLKPWVAVGLVRVVEPDWRPDLIRRRGVRYRRAAAG